MMLAFWALFSVLISAACSLFETVLLSARPIQLLSRKNEPGVGRFIEIKEERLGDAISAILTINTIACTIGPGFVGAEAARIWGDPAVAVASVLLTLLILILSEIAPKTYAATHAEGLAAVTGHVLGPALWFLAPILIITRRLTEWLSGDREGTVTRNSLAQMIVYAPSQGALSERESDILSHMLFAHQITLADAHTPMDFIASLPETTTVAALIDEEADTRFARIPIYDDNPGRLTSYINQREVLRAALSEKRPRNTPVSAFRHDLPEMEETMSVGRAIATLLEKHEPIGAVMCKGRTIGIVTLEDLFEALLGVDITDEAEEIAAERSEADVRRRNRIQQLRKRRRQWTQGQSPNIET